VSNERAPLWSCRPPLPASCRRSPEHPLAGNMQLPHGRRHRRPSQGTVEFAVPALAASVGMGAALFLHSSCSVTPGRRRSRWIAAQSGCGRWFVAVACGGGYRRNSSAAIKLSRRPLTSRSLNRREAGGITPIPKSNSARGWWDTLGKKHNDHMELKTVPLFANILILLNSCTPLGSANYVKYLWI
jgi:hypothetical protein